MKKLISVFLMLLFIFPPVKFIFPRTNLLIPSYFYDDTLFRKIIDTKTYQNLFVIVNVNNGPGDEIDGNYKNWIKALNSTNKIVVGYVYSSYGKRNLDEVKNDIKAWIKFYPEIKGFFIDEISDATDKNEFNYYLEISNFIKNFNKKYFVIFNPGNSNINPDLAKITDIIVIFEDSYENLKTFKRPAWISKNLNNTKFAGIVYDVEKSNLNNVYNTLIRNGIGTIYITDDADDNPYDSLPTYYDELIKLISRKIIPPIYKKPDS